MKTIIFSVLFALGTFVSVQAQQLTILVTNNSRGTWAYKAADAKNGVIVNQQFEPGASIKFNVPSMDFPINWGAQDEGGCYASGTHTAPNSGSNNFACTNATLGQKLVQLDSGDYVLYVVMQ